MSCHEVHPRVPYIPVRIAKQVYCCSCLLLLRRSTPDPAIHYSDQRTTHAASTTADEFSLLGETLAIPLPYKERSTSERNNTFPSIPDDPSTLLRQHLRHSCPRRVQLAQAREVLIPPQVLYLVDIEKLAMNA